MQNVWVVIAAYNEESVLGSVLDRVLKVCPNVVVVDDGSSDKTFSVIRNYPVHGLKHSINLGQGAALQTGITYALLKDAATVVTFDADGQMDESDIERLCEVLKDGKYDVALGSRFLNMKYSGMGFLKKMILQLAVLFTSVSTGLKLTDTHNGFRAFTREAAKKVNLRQNRMAHASEFFDIIASQKLRYIEVPVSIKYTAYSVGKGQRLHNSLNILWDLFFNK